jgi:sortase (surface protein transpeptidase)
MKNKKPLLIVLLILLLLGGLVGLYIYNQVQIDNEENRQIAQRKLSQGQFGWRFPTVGFPETGEGDTSLLAYSSIRDPGGIPEGLPVRLQIPSIGVNTAIEDALITPDGRMDVPAGSINVAWFALGPYPGRIGSAVIGGHYGIDNGVPKVFYNLSELQIGAIVNIIDDRGKTLSFIVRSKKSFDRNDDATTVFTSQDGLAHLNLITCEGIWNQVDDTYPQRTVIFTDAITTQQADVTAPSLPETAETSPVPTSQPETQQSPSPSAQAEASPKIAASPSPELVGPEPIEPVPPSFREDLSTIIKILFSHPLDIGITLLLLSSITLIIFKIIRR